MFIIKVIKHMEESPSPQKESPSTRKELQSSPHKQIDSRWVQLKFAHSFTPRSYFASCIQAGNIYIHGGFNAELGIMKDLLVCCMYDLPATWKALPAKNSKQCSPGPVRNHTLSSYKSNLILIGGQQNVVDNNKEIFKYDLLTNTWHLCKCSDKQQNKLNYALDSHSALVHKNTLYVFGGYDAISTMYQDVIIKISLEQLSEDTLTFENIQPENRPSPRGNASCCLVQNEIYVFGGGRVADVYNDLWTFSIETQQWKQVQKRVQNIVWPEKRKGGTLVLHNESGNMFLFGGIKTITKECNDIHVWITDKQRWIKIHSNTNELYDPSPRVKRELQSPSISDEKRKKEKFKTFQGFQTFKIGIQAVSNSTSYKPIETGNQFHRKQNSVGKIEGIETVTDFKRKMSVVQEKKYREFMNRKKKLLSNIESGYDKTKERRTHSPTSEAIIFSLSTMGQQQRNQKSDYDLPKVIYNEDKGQVIGKKPCARDGHAAVVHEENMIILGGDRHMVSFKDAYLFKMNKGVESLPRYQ